jgi:ribosomal protein S2
VPAHAQAVSIAAQRCGSPFVVGRWVGGTLTNFRSVARAIASLDATTADAADAPASAAAAAPPKGLGSKKAAAVVAAAAARAERRVGTLRGMASLPGAVFVVDAAAHAKPLAEAAAVGIPVVALCDSDTAHPENIDFPVPANARAPAAIRLLCELAARAVLHGTGAEPPETTWRRQTSEGSTDGDGDGGKEDDATKRAFSFYGGWGGFAPLRTALAGVGRPRGRTGGGKRHRKTAGGPGGGRGALGRTQRRLGA